MDKIDTDEYQTEQEKRDIFKKKILNCIEIIDRWKDYNIVDVIFCRLDNNLTFGLEFNNYIVLYFPDEENGSCNDDYYIGGDEIIIEYLKKDRNNKELSYNLWKQQKDKSFGICNNYEIDCYSKRISFEDIF